MRIFVAFVAASAIIALSGSVSAQTQPTRPSALTTLPTLHSAFPTSPLSPCYSPLNLTSPCYSGNRFPYFSAVPLDTLTTPKPSEKIDISQFNEQEVELRIKAKGYDGITELQKDRRGVWRGVARLKDGRRVQVTLDLEGNVYSKLATPVDIWIRD